MFFRSFFSPLSRFSTSLFPNFDISKMYKNPLIIFLSAIVIVFIVVSLEQIPFFEDMENRALDYRFKLYPSPVDTAEISLVTIDDGSLTYFVKNGISWPWPRDFYAHVIDYFHTAGAKAVLLDILFYEPDIDRFDVDAHYTDSRFAAAMNNYEKTILASLILPDSTLIPAQLKGHHYDLQEDIKNAIPHRKGIRAPIKSFLEAAGQVGDIAVYPDNDGIIRRVPLFHKLDNIIIPQFTVAALYLAYKDNESHPLFHLENNVWRYNNQKLPVDRDGNYLVNWQYGEGPEGAFNYYSFRSIIQSASAYQAGYEPQLPPDYFKDKYIIIGATAPGLRDLVPTPISQTHPGMELWATVLNNFLNDDFIKTTPPWISALYLFVISFLIMYTFVRNPLKVGNYLLPVIVTLVIIIPLIGWSNFPINIKITAPLITLIISFMYITLVSYISEGRSKKEIKKAFSRYLHPQIIERLVENPKIVDLEGSDFNATMLFSDIYNFTTFSEDKEPKKLISLLNNYFESLTSNILDNEGMLDKFMGDGIMAVFGLPLETEDHAYKSCRSALTHKKEWQSFYQDIKHQENHLALFHLQTRIGINTGAVVAGNIGSERRIDYTVIGDAVNLASRLEGINKYYGTSIIISSSTYEMVKDKFICRELDYLKVKGKNQPTKIFELLDFIDSQEVDYKWIDEYIQALNHYRKGEWDKAVTIFSKLYNHPLNDKPSKIMLDRCLELKESNPDNWDGIYKLEVK